MVTGMWALHEGFPLSKPNPSTTTIKFPICQQRIPTLSLQYGTIPWGDQLVTWWLEGVRWVPCRLSLQVKVLVILALGWLYHSIFNGQLCWSLSPTPHQGTNCFFRGCPSAVGWVVALWEGEIATLPWMGLHFSFCTRPCKLLSWPCW